MSSQIWVRSFEIRVAQFNVGVHEMRPKKRACSTRPYKNNSMSGQIWVRSFEIRVAQFNVGVHEMRPRKRACFTRPYKNNSMSSQIWVRSFEIRVAQFNVGVHEMRPRKRACFTRPYKTNSRSGRDKRWALGKSAIGKSSSFTFLCRFQPRTLNAARSTHFHRPLKVGLETVPLKIVVKAGI